MFFFLPKKRHRENWAPLFTSSKKWVFSSCPMSSPVTATARLASRFPASRVGPGRPGQRLGGQHGEGEVRRHRLLRRAAGGPHHQSGAPLHRVRHHAATAPPLWVTARPTHPPAGRRAKPPWRPFRPQKAVRAAEARTHRPSTPMCSEVLDGKSWWGSTLGGLTRT